MNRTYTLKGGVKINTFYSRYSGLTEYDANGNEVAHYNIHYLDDKRVVYRKGEVIYLDNFDYTPLSEMINKLNQCVEQKDRWIISNDEVLATFIHEKDKLGLVSTVENLGRRCVYWGDTGVTLEDSDEVLLVPFEDEYTIEDWHYKMEFRALDPVVHESVRGIRTYTDDIIDMIKMGIYRVVDKDEYLKEHPMQVEEAEA